MQAAVHSPGGVKDDHLVAALKDLGFAVKSLQLYPPTSPVVRTAVDRSYASLAALLDGGRLTLEITPSFVRHGDTEVGAGNALVEQLSKRLHGHSIARLHFDSLVAKNSLQTLAELVAADRKEYDQHGGLEVVFSNNPPTGVQAEFLELERLFDGEAEREVEDIWVALLDGFSNAADVEDVDWASLANNAERLQDFVGWLTENVDGIAQRTGYENIDVYKFVVEHMGSIAAGLGSENVNFLVLAMRRIFDRVDPDTLIELLIDPLEVEVEGEEPGSAGAPSLSEFLGEAGTSSLDSGGARADGRTIDITGLIASGLEPSQAQELILHTMRTRKESSARLYGLFSRLMEGREERIPAARRVRGLLQQQIAESDGDLNMLDDWPRLADVLDGEAPERFISSAYDTTMQALLVDDSLKGVWDVDRIRPRLGEMRPAFVVQRKALVLAAVLDIEEDEERYQTIARELEKALHELIVHDHYDLALQLLLRIQDVLDDPAKAGTQKQIAESIIDGFYKPDVLRQLLRNALGRADRQGDAIIKILRHRTEKAVPVLLDTLADENTRRVRQRLLQILNSLGETAIAAVAERLDDERWYFLRNLLLLLGESGDQSQLNHVVPLAQHGDARVRRHAIEAIIKLGNKRSSALLLTATDDPDEDVRLVAIYGLGFHASQRGVKRLRRLLRLPNLRGQNTPIVKTAAIALGRLKDTDSASQLSALAQKAWLFPARRQAACEAATWAITALGTDKPGVPPEPAALRGLRPGEPSPTARV